MSKEETCQHFSGFDIENPQVCGKNVTHKVTYFRLADGLQETKHRCALHALVVNSLWIVTDCKELDIKHESNILNKLMQAAIKSGLPDYDGRDPIAKIGTLHNVYITQESLPLSIEFYIARSILYANGRPICVSNDDSAWGFGKALEVIFGNDFESNKKFGNE
jgi:hypothetical protein